MLLLDEVYVTETTPLGTAARGALDLIRLPSPTGTSGLHGRMHQLLGGLAFTADRL